jgi:hypothetical protein
MGTGFRSRPSSRWNPLHDDFHSHFVSRDANAILAMYESRWLHTLIVHMYQSSGHRIRCLRSALEESRAPKPFIDPQSGRFVIPLSFHF